MSIVTRLHAVTEPGRLVNCWVIDVGEGLVTVDSSLLPSDALAHRARIDAMGKPVLRALLTHGHPDHVVGVGALLDGLDVPVYAVPGVGEVMRGYEQVYAGRSAELPPEERVETWRYPDVALAGGQTLEFGDATVRVEDIGNGGDCPVNSIFWLEAPDSAAFTADLALRTTRGSSMAACWRGWPTWSACCRWCVRSTAFIQVTWKARTRACSWTSATTCCISPPRSRSSPKADRPCSPGQKPSWSDE